jgi:hypothetical protein
MWPAPGWRRRAEWTPRPRGPPASGGNTGQALLAIPHRDPSNDLVPQGRFQSSPCCTRAAEVMGEDQDSWHIYDEKLTAAKEKLTLIHYIL